MDLLTLFLAGSVGVLYLDLYGAFFSSRRFAEDSKGDDFEVTQKLIHVSKKIIGTSLSLEEIRNINKGFTVLLSGNILTRGYGRLYEDRDTQANKQLYNDNKRIGFQTSQTTKNSDQDNKISQVEDKRIKDNGRVLDRVSIATQDNQVFTLVFKRDSEEDKSSFMPRILSRILNNLPLGKIVRRFDLDLINKPKIIKVPNLSAYQKQFEDASNFGQPISLLFNRLSGEIRVLQIQSREIKHSRLESALQSPQLNKSSSKNIPLSIDFIFDGNFSESQISVFRQAALRWSNIIRGNLTPIMINGRRVEGILITARSLEIDGPHNRLAQAGPLQLRPDTLLPVTGIIEFDSADLNALEDSGSLLNVVTHEIAHVLGFGTLWEQKGLIQGIGTDNPSFVGENAMREYANLIKANQPIPVPLETSGIEGTQYDHWRESIFREELMTGYINRGFNPLSIVTIASFEDLGYSINLESADSYEAVNNLLSEMNKSGEEKCSCNEKK